MPARSLFPQHTHSPSHTHTDTRTHTCARVHTRMPDRGTTHNDLYVINYVTERLLQLRQLWTPQLLFIITAQQQTSVILFSTILIPALHCFCWLLHYLFRKPCRLRINVAGCISWVMTTLHLLILNSFGLSTISDQFSTSSVMNHYHETHRDHTAETTLLNTSRHRQIFTYWIRRFYRSGMAPLDPEVSNPAR